MLVSMWLVIIVRTSLVRRKSMRLKKSTVKSVGTRNVSNVNHRIPTILVRNGRTKTI